MIKQFAELKSFSFFYVKSNLLSNKFLRYKSLLLLRLSNSKYL